jgi:UDP-N-acetyl-D-galactosamine dehydrogenase
MNEPKMPTVAIVGLGYVGLPLAVEFAKIFPTIGYDLSEEKVGNFVAMKIRPARCAVSSSRRPDT